MRLLTTLTGLILAGFGMLYGMDSQFGYYEVQDRRITINIMVKNGLCQPVEVSLRSNHFDKTFCPTKQVQFAPGQEKNIRFVVNGRCVYGKYQYSLVVTDIAGQQATTLPILFGYEESTINSIPVELQETYEIEQPGAACKEFCVIRRAECPR